MAWNATVTNVGAELLARWGGGESLVIDGAKGGTGRVAVAQLANQTAIKMASGGDALALNLSDWKRAETGITFNVTINAFSPSAVDIAQIGIFAHVGTEAETLLAIYQCDEGEEIHAPSEAEMPDFAYRFAATVMMSNTGTLQVTVDPRALVNVAGMTAAIQDALPRYRTITLAPGDWSYGNLVYTAVYEDVSITEQTCVIQSDVPEYVPTLPGGRIEWLACDGYLEFTARVQPTQSITLTVALVESSGEQGPWGRLMDTVHTGMIYNGLDQTASGYALDARQGKALDDRLDALESVTGMYLTGTTWETLYAELTAMTVNKTTTYKCDAPVTNLLTGGKVSSITFGIVARLTNTIYEFFAGPGNSGTYYKWRITFASGGTSATVGTVYSFSGTAI